MDTGEERIGHVHGSNAGRGTRSGTDPREGRSAALQTVTSSAPRATVTTRRSNTYRSLDIGEGLASGEGGCGELDGLGDGDDLGAVGEGERVVAEGRELAHDSLELGHHRSVVGCGVVRRGAREECDEKKTH